MGVVGWINPLQTLSQGLVLTFRFTFDPEYEHGKGRRKDENNDNDKVMSDIGI